READAAAVSLSRKDHGRERGRCSGRISGLADAGGRAGFLHREDQGAQREPSRIARSGAGRARRRGVDGLRRAPGARGLGRDRRRPRQSLPLVKLLVALAGIGLAGIALAGGAVASAGAADMIPEPLAQLQGLDKTTARVSQFDAAIGATVRFGNLSIVVRDCRRSPPEERPENAAFVEIYETRPGEAKERL